MPPGKPGDEKYAQVTLKRLQSLFAAAVFLVPAPPTCAVIALIADATTVLLAVGLIDEYGFVVQPRLAGHGPTLFPRLSKHIDLKLVSRLEFGSGAVAMRCEPRR